MLGALVEKAFTTPDIYPMTINALMSACNQRSNRDPVVEYDESTIHDALRGLESRGLASITRASGGRTVRYVHRVQSALEIDDEQASLVAVLLLRGPQTPGELRSRTDRYVHFEGVGAVESRLTDLVERDIALVERLERLPGQKEHRYHCLLLPGDHRTSHEPPTPDRLDELERRIARIEAALGLDEEE